MNPTHFEQNKTAFIMPAITVTLNINKNSVIAFAWRYRPFSELYIYQHVL